MKVFVLLLYVSSIKAGGGMSAEFNSEAACNNAGEAFYNKMNQDRSRFTAAIPVNWVCVPKD